MCNFKLDPPLISTNYKTSMRLAMIQKNFGYIIFLHDNTWHFSLPKNMFAGILRFSFCLKIEKYNAMVNV
jgi:hypothetical protein